MSTDEKLKQRPVRKKVTTKGKTVKKRKTPPMVEKTPPMVEQPKKKKKSGGFFSFLFGKKKSEQEDVEQRDAGQRAQPDLESPNNDELFNEEVPTESRGEQVAFSKRTKRTRKSNKITEDFPSEIYDDDVLKDLHDRVEAKESVTKTEEVNDDIFADMEFPTISEEAPVQKEAETDIFGNPVDAVEVDKSVDFSQVEFPEFPMMESRENQTAEEPVKKESKGLSKFVDGELLGRLRNAVIAYGKRNSGVFSNDIVVKYVDDSLNKVQVEGGVLLLPCYKIFVNGKNREWDSVGEIRLSKDDEKIEIELGVTLSVPDNCVIRISEPIDSQDKFGLKVKQTVLNRQDALWRITLCAEAVRNCVYVQKKNFLLRAEVFNESDCA